MRFLTARRLALFALLPALLLFSVVPGCSNESEGQRCGNELVNDADCADGLVCVVAGQLLNSNGANRCCRSDKIVTDSRCLPATSAPVITGSTADAAGASGAGN